jgi:hypothetical protein
MPERALERRHVERSIDSSIPADIIKRHLGVHDLVEPNLSLRTGEGMSGARRVRRSLDAGHLPGVYS